MKGVPWFLEISHFFIFQLQLELVSDKCNKFGISRLAFCIADSIAEEALEGIQVTSVPGNFNSVSDSAFYAAGSGLESLCHLGVQDFRDGIDHVHIIHGDDDGLPQILIAFDMSGNTDLVGWVVYGVMLSCLLS